MKPELAQRRIQSGRDRSNAAYFASVPHFQVPGRLQLALNGRD